MYADVKDSFCDIEVDMENANNDDRASVSEENREDELQNGEGDEEEEKEEQQQKNGVEKEEEMAARGERCNISKAIGNRTTYIHSREPWSSSYPESLRCRQKRHWAAKYLPGKVPIDPKHDIIKFSHVALKSVQQGQKVFDIAHAEGIQSVKDHAQRSQVSN